MDYRRQAEALAKTEAEIREEMASSLGRVARALEARLERLSALAGTLATLSGEQRARAADEYRALHREATDLRWNLLVQREAMGLRDQSAVDRHYPIPPRLA